MNNPDKIDPADIALWRQAGSHAPPRDGGGCPDELTLAAWLDGRTDEAALADIDRHLTACPRCLHMVAELRQLLNGEPVLAPAPVLHRAMAVVPARGGLIGRLARWSAAAAAIMLVSSLGFYTGGATHLAGTPADIQPGRAVAEVQPDVVVREATAGLVDADEQIMLDGDDLLIVVSAWP